jgi:hypothetical protein
MESYNAMILRAHTHKMAQHRKCLNYIDNPLQPPPNYYKILVCTPSNSAIDLITNKIIHEGLMHVSGGEDGVIESINEVDYEKEKEKMK